jgi:DUF4097 and DUF4098 domain-containing protein YvlB
MRTQTFQTPGSVTLELSVPAGSIELETRDGETTTVEIEGPDEDEFHVELRERGDRITVSVEAPRKRLGLSSSRHRVAVKAPPGADVQAKAGSADLEARGSYGAVDVQTGSGEIDVHEAAALRVKSGSGDLTARSVDGEVSALSGSGDVEIGRVGGGGSVKTGSGDVRIAEADGDITIMTASGDQTIGSAGSGRLKLRAASGDVHLGIRRGSRVFVDARSASGDMESELELEGEPPPGDGPMVEVDATTASGDVRITRA